VDLGFLVSNKTFHHSRWSLSIACLSFIHIIFKSSSTSSLHLLRALPLFLIFSTVAVAICFWYSLVLHYFNVTKPSESEVFYKFYSTFAL
jgi:hypothetical protein